MLAKSTFEENFRHINKLFFKTPRNGRSSHQRCFIEIGVLKNFTKFTGKYLRQSFFFNNFIKKETLAHVFSCEFCEIFKNTFFTEYLRTTASRMAATNYCLNYIKSRTSEGLRKISDPKRNSRKRNCKVHEMENNTSLE